MERPQWKWFVSFFTVLWIAAVQMRKDLPRKWFSDNPLYVIVQIKRIMSGRRFGQILHGLHVGPVATSSTELYNPNIKLREFPGGMNSTDNTLRLVKLSLLMKPWFVHLDKSNLKYVSYQNQLDMESNYMLSWMQRLDLFIRHVCWIFRQFVQ